MKKTMTKEEVKKLANDLMFDLSEEEADEVISEFSVLEDQLALLEKIDTTNVEEMEYPFEMETSYLREDEVSHIVDVKDALSNAKQTRKNYVILPRVVK